ncbi:(2E,6E)-farnesyl diphosphate synthase [Pseudidiomarina aestuarii]|uniref:(2E,6E)-farnesyl diphosphate synthase n=1 Tax=Pseudidiomarina aestuarii TaxID=624146 RepID=A0A7Z7ESR6_9GAMM|nr:farnesyl diphosphate synthase [Pseudidiomarina aestuarii]RUO39165.1 (2E,6E)-farnesyl diphosphate synthase [Pseudidiomarina aestuarii]
MTLNAVLAAARERVDSFLTHSLERSDRPAEQLNQAMQYALLLGGKRVRPFLTYQVGQLCHADQNVLDHAAAAVECIHAYSLIHDDLPAMDDDSLRRGQPTCHIAFDEATAILAGDALQSLAFEILSAPGLTVSPTAQLSMLNALAIASGDRGMCAGQALDLDATAKQLIEAELARVHRHKTGALIRCAVTLGVLAGDAEAQQWRADFESFADYLGLAFQVQDDILDVTGSTTALGKSQGSDRAANKATYVSVLGLAGAQECLHNLHQKALHALRRIPYNTQTLESFAEALLNRDH